MSRVLVLVALCLFALVLAALPMAGLYYWYGLWPMLVVGLPFVAIWFLYVGGRSQRTVLGWMFDDVYLAPHDWRMAEALRGLYKGHVPLRMAPALLRPWKGQVWGLRLFWVPFVIATLGCIAVWTTAIVRSLST
jgi:hypothetical protein